MKRVLVPLIVLLAGCGGGSTTVELPGGKQTVTIVRNDWIHFIGWPDQIDCVTEYPRIFVRAGRNPDVAELAHEFLHAQRQFEIGYSTWEHKYKTDEAFRLNEEVLGYRVQLDGDAPDPGKPSNPPTQAWVTAENKRYDLAYSYAYSIVNFYNLHGLNVHDVSVLLLAK